MFQWVGLWNRQQRKENDSEETENQKKYLSNVFDIGKQTGQKADPRTVSLSMRKARNTDGSYIFDASDYLSAKQISFFSRLARKRKQVDDTEEEDSNDVQERMHEENMEFLKER